jgi:hypothetical protein
MELSRPADHSTALGVHSGPGGCSRCQVKGSAPANCYVLSSFLSAFSFSINPSPGTPDQVISSGIGPPVHSVTIVFLAFPLRSCGYSFFIPSWWRCHLLLLIFKVAASTVSSKLRNECIPINWRYCVRFARAPQITVVPPRSSVAL